MGGGGEGPFFDLTLLTTGLLIRRVNRLQVQLTGILYTVCRAKDMMYIMPPGPILYKME